MCFFVVNKEKIKSYLVSVTYGGCAICNINSDAK